jgi:Cd2+/Zn2+-exporting ATPase
LESVGKLKALAVDKTGTITVGKPAVTRAVQVNAASEEEILRIAAAIDSHSTHPLAQAVVAHARERGIAFPHGEQYRASGGQGAEAVIDGHHYFVGNHRFTHEMAVCSPEVERQLALIEGEAQSVVVVGHRPHADCRGEVLGILAISDALRPEAPAALAELHRLGVRPVVMLSGDNSRTVNAIAQKAGIDDAYGDLLPEKKTECLQALMAEHGVVGMIGDGVNDAPALAAASVGIAMGKGTDTALETADMALMNDDLGKVAEAVRLGRRTMRIIRANIIFALGLKAVFLILALTGYATLWMAIVADTGATLLVIANALRLLRSR